MPDGLATDNLLIRAAQMGDTSALAALYDRYLPTIWRYVFRRIDGDRQAAEDVVSETFLAAVRDIANLDAQRCVVAAWLTGIARHKLGDHRRRIRRQPDLQDDEQLALAAGAARGDPKIAAQNRELRRLIDDALDRLPDEQRLVLEWKAVDRLSVRQIGDRLDRSDKAIESILYRARKTLRALLDSNLHDRD